jgi:hypothetical protein
MADSAVEACQCQSCIPDDIDLAMCFNVFDARCGELQ